jgi:HSP20 family protein
MANELRCVDPRFGGSLDQFFNDFFTAAPARDPALISPSIDVSENESRLLITSELPGLERKDIDLSVKDGVLMIRGEKRMEEEAREGRFHRIERRYGSFYRALALPDTVEAEKVDARFKDGVLRITLPKRPEAKARSIPVQE